MLAIDLRLLGWLNPQNDAVPWMMQLARVASLDLPAALLGLLLILLLVGPSNRRETAARVLLAMLLAWLAARTIQYLWPMPRPFAMGFGTAWIAHAGSAGFPSTHASVAMAFGMAAASRSSRPWLRVLALSPALLISWSRIYLGLHFPSDVLAAILLGCLSALSVGLIPTMQTLGRQRGTRPVKR